MNFPECFPARAAGCCVICFVCTHVIYMRVFFTFLCQSWKLCAPHLNLFILIKEKCDHIIIRNEIVRDVSMLLLLCIAHQGNKFSFKWDNLLFIYFFPLSRRTARVHAVEANKMHDVIKRCCRRRRLQQLAHRKTLNSIKFTKYDKREHDRAFDFFFVCYIMLIVLCIIYVFILLYI